MAGKDAVAHSRIAAFNRLFKPLRTAAPSRQARPTKAQPAKAQPAKAQPTLIKAEPTKTQPTKTQPTKTQPTKTQPAEPAGKCPVCARDFGELLGDSEDAAHHVNLCLDLAELAERKKKRGRPAAECQPDSGSKRAAAEAGSRGAAGLDAPDPWASAACRGLSIDQILTNPHVPQPPAASAAAEHAYVYTVQADTAPAASQSTRPLASYKRMPQTPFLVDAFPAGLDTSCTAYFLTHFHSDHYGTLGRGFGGHVYCSRTTANLVVSQLKVDPAHVHALPMHTRCVVHGVHVTLLDAGHCPGSTVIVFEARGEAGAVTRSVHTGDFRASRLQVAQIERIARTPLQQPIRARDLEHCEGGHRHAPAIDYLFLDTTYLDPAYALPSQQSVVSGVADFARRIAASPAHLPAHLARAARCPRRAPPAKKTHAAALTTWFRRTPAAQPSTRRSTSARPVLFAVGAYTIGKEKLALGIARRLRSRVFVSGERRKVLRALESDALARVLTDDPRRARVHIVPVSKVTLAAMHRYFAGLADAFSRVVAFRPTGWALAASGFARSPGQTQLPPPLSALECPADAAAAAGIVRDPEFYHDMLVPHGRADRVVVFPVPYSEHSSFSELARFVCALNVRSVVPTVRSTAERERAGAEWLRRWEVVKAALGPPHGVSGEAPVLPFQDADEKDEAPVLPFQDADEKDEAKAASDLKMEIKNIEL